MMETSPWFILGAFLGAISGICWIVIGLKNWGKSSLKELTVFETRLGVVSVILALSGVVLVILGIVVI